MKVTAIASSLCIRDCPRPVTILALLFLSSGIASLFSSKDVSISPVSSLRIELPGVEALSSVTHGLKLTLHELLALWNGIRQIKVGLEVSISSTTLLDDLPASAILLVDNITLSIDLRLALVGAFLSLNHRLIFLSHLNGYNSALRVIL